MTDIKELFRDCQVDAESVEDFCNRYHKRESYHERGKEYMKYDIADHKTELESSGYTIITHHESVTGKTVAYFE